jgi:hypothetical protein
MHNQKLPLLINELIVGVLILKPGRITQARHEAQRLLGVTEISVTALVERARAVLGPERTTLILALIKEAPLSRRSVLLPGLAELVAGSQFVGAPWWSQPHREPFDQPGETHQTPDQILTSAQAPERKLTLLGAWIVEEAADQAWGIPVDYIDLNEPDFNDLVRLPATAQNGDRLLVAFDAGGRVWAQVVKRKKPAAAPIEERLGLRRGMLGSKLLDSFYHPAAEIWWQWAVAQADEPLRLPDEIPDTPSDPFVTPVDQLVVEKLVNWLRAQGLDAQESGLPWTNKADLWRARTRLKLPTGRTGDWWPLDQAILAILDNDPLALTQALSELTC